MKKNMKRLVAIIALAAIAALIIAYVVSAFLADSGEAGNRFFGLFFGLSPFRYWLGFWCSALRSCLTGRTMITVTNLNRTLPVNPKANLHLCPICFL